MTDWYFTDSSKQKGFQARPVVGGVFIKMLAADSVWKKWAGRSQKISGTWAHIPTPPKIDVIEGGPRSDGVVWRYTTSRPGNDWTRINYNDRQWKSGPGGFGTEGTPGAVVRTRWDTSDIYLRREIILSEGTDLKSLQLYVHHDEDVKIFLNGILAAQAIGFTTDYEPLEILPAAQAALRPGKNHLAVQCHQTSGGQYIDVGLVSVGE